MQNPLLSQWYLQKINKVILPPNLHGAQQMQQTKAGKAEGGRPDSSPSLQKFSLVIESQVLAQVHSGHHLAGP